MLRGGAALGRYGMRGGLTSLLAVLTFFGSFVVSPCILMLNGPRSSLTALSLLGLGLLALGLSVLMGALLMRFYDRGRCSHTQRFAWMSANWLLNPVCVAVLGAQVQSTYLMLWSATPLGLVVLICTWKLQVLAGDPAWFREIRGYRCCVTWICSRILCIVLPMGLLSMQVALYVPIIVPQLPAEREREMSVVGGCVLITAKFFLICGQLPTRPTQALVLLILLSADWTCILNLLALFKDEMEFGALLLHLWFAGVLEFRDSLKELKVCARRRQRLDGSTSDSDSDSDRHETVMASFNFAVLKVLGITTEETAQRQFLCAARRALIVAPAAPAGVGMQPVSTRVVLPQPPAASGGVSASIAAPTASSSSSLGTSDAAADSSASAMELGEAAPASAAAPEMEIQVEETCSICLTKFQSGDSVRPLPKCAHLFHAECLESWARQKQESTPCPVCRRPALTRKAAEGAVSVSSLGAPPPSVSTRSGRGRGGGRGGRERQGRRTAQPRNPQARSGRTAAAAQQETTSSAAADMRASLGVSLTMAEVTLEVADGDLNIAANLLMEHASMVEAFAASRMRRRANRAPRGMAEAIAGTENPFLAGAEAALDVQLSFLVQQNRLEGTAWEMLSSAQQREAQRAIMTHVSEHQLERAS